MNALALKVPDSRRQGSSVVDLAQYRRRRALERRKPWIAVAAAALLAALLAVLAPHVGSSAFAADDDATPVPFLPSY